MAAFFNHRGQTLSRQERDNFYKMQKRGVVYWLQNPVSLQTVGPFFEKFPRVPEYEGWNVYGFTPDIVGTVIVEKDKPCGSGLPWWGPDNQSHVSQCIVKEPHIYHEGWVGDHLETWQ